MYSFFSTVLKIPNLRIEREVKCSGPENKATSRAHCNTWFKIKTCTNIGNHVTCDLQIGPRAYRAYPDYRNPIPALHAFCTTYMRAGTNIQLSNDLV